MALTNAQKAKLGGAAAAIAALVVASVVAFGPPTDKHGPGIHGVLEDAGLLHAGKGGTMTDLLSGEIDQGATGTTGVNLSPGSTAGEVVGPPTFEVISTTSTVKPDGFVWVEVTVKNNGPKARFAGFLEFTLPAADAGIDAP